MKFITKRIKLYIAIIVGIIVVSITSAGITLALGSVRAGSGALSRFDTTETNHEQSENDSACTSSTTYVDMPDMTKTFTQGGLFASQALVMFQSQVPSDTETGYANLGSIRLLVDGTVQDGAGSNLTVSAYGPAPTVNGRGWTFMTNSLGVGSHTAKFQWKTDRSNDSNAQFCTQNRAMTILHN